MVSYDGEEGWYNITISGLSTSKKIFNILLSEEVKFDYIKSNKGDIYKAWYKPQDKTDKINSIGNGYQHANKDIIFDVFFEGELNNGDIISLYIKNSDSSNIYLCDPSTECNSPGYGLVYYDGEEGWYNITINGLSSPQNAFNIDPTRVKIDYIESIHYLDTEATFTSPAYDSSLNVDWGEISWEGNIPSETDIKLQTRTSSDNINWNDWSSEYENSGEQITSDNNRYIQFRAILTGLINLPTLNSVAISYTSTAYISSGIIETRDITANDLIKWNSFTKTHILNNQNIDYYYSLDSGSNWVEVLSDGDLSSVDTSTGKIRFKSVLSSDESSTPLIEEMRLIYTACQENWQVNYGDCLTNDTKLKTHIDSNNCGTANNLPSDNGTYVECDYCNPNWLEINTSCNTNNTLTGYFIDNNNCYTQTGLVSDNNALSNNTYVCDYCSEDINEYYTDWGICLVNDTKIRTKYFVDENYYSCCAVTGLSSDCSIDTNFNNVTEYEICDYCIPNWACTQYDTCKSNNKISCLNATDSNSCYQQTNLNSDLYSGNYSEFEQICLYDKTAPLLVNVFIEPKKASRGDLINITADVTDISNISYVKSIVKDSKGELIKEINLESKGDLFTSILNTSNMSKGTYVVNFDTEDILGNQVYYSFKGIIALDYSAEDAITIRKEFYTNKKSTINNSDIVLEILPSRSISNVSIGMAKYSDNIKDIIPEGVKDIRKFIDILPDEDVKNSTEKVTIRIYYNDSEIQNMNINEETLKIYHYNEDTSNWDVLNSTVNTSANYVEVIVNHFSTYAVFGEEVKGETVQISGSGGAGSFGGGSRGGSVTISKKKEEIKKETEKFEKKKTEETREVCKYSYNIDIPTEISFLENDVVMGQIKNDGNCLLDKVEINLTPTILEHVVINNTVFENIEKGKSVDFYLTLKHDETTSREKLMAQGFVIKALRNVIQTYKGEVITKGTAQNSMLQEKKKNIEIMLLKPADFKTIVRDRLVFLIPNMISMLIAIFVLIVLIRKSRSKQKKPLFFQS